MKDLSILSLNLWNVKGPVEERMISLIKYIKNNKPDVVVLQEVSYFANLLQCNYIGSMTNYEYIHYLKSGFWQGVEEGIAILTKNKSEIIVKESLPSSSDDMPRKLLVAQICLDKDGVSNCYVANTHLAFRATDGELRLRQVCQILTSLQKYGKNKENLIIICGDLNDTPQSLPVRRLFCNNKIELFDAWVLNNGQDNDGHTFAKENSWALPELAPGRRIDYIAVSGNALVKSCKIVMTGHDGWAPVSDHYGLFTIINKRDS
jgi:endonuclease/exonuclease/phosphatase family metal-dependent hydrolase